MWEKESFLESFYGVELGLSLPSTFAHISLSLSVYLSVSFYHFLLRMIKLSFRKKLASKPVVQFGTQMTPFSTWDSVFLSCAHWAGTTPPPNYENEKWLQTLPDIPCWECCPWLRTTGVAHLFHSLC